jgi:hypothetical protein
MPSISQRLHELADQIHSMVYETAERHRAMGAEIAALKVEVERLRGLLTDHGRCTECGDDADGCYCAEDAEPIDAAQRQQGGQRREGGG